MSEIGDRVEMAVAWLRIRDGFEYESIAAATTRHRIATAATNEGVVLRAAYECIGIRATNEDEGIMAGPRLGAAVDVAVLNAAGRQSACRHCRRSSG